MHVSETDNQGNTYGAFYQADLSGTLDSQFGVGGVVTSSPLPAAEGQDEGLSAVAVQPDGSIVACRIGLQPVTSLVRVNASGNPDGTTFDDVSSQIPTITAIAIQPTVGWASSPSVDTDPQTSDTFGIVAAGISPLPEGEGSFPVSLRAHGTVCQMVSRPQRRDTLGRYTLNRLKMNSGSEQTIAMMPRQYQGV